MSASYFENWESLLKTTRTQEIISTLWWKEDAFVWHILHWNDGVSVSSITIKVLPGEHRESHSSTRKHTHSTSSTSNKPEMRFRTTPREFFFYPVWIIWITLTYTFESRLKHIWITFESSISKNFSSTIWTVTTKLLGLRCFASRGQIVSTHNWMPVKVRKAKSLLFGHLYWHQIILEWRKRGQVSCVSQNAILIPYSPFGACVMAAAALPSFSSTEAVCGLSSSSDADSTPTPDTCGLVVLLSIKFFQHTLSMQ